MTNLGRIIKYKKPEEASARSGEIEVFYLRKVRRKVNKFVFY